MTITAPTQNASIPSYIRQIKDAEKQNLQTMLVLLGAEVAYVAITAIVGLPVWAILGGTGALVAVMGFFAYRNYRWTRVLKTLDAAIKKELEFNRFMHSIR